MARQLSITEKVRLHLHLQVCRLCSIYEKKVHFLDKSLERQIENKESNIFESSEIESFKKKVQKKITNVQNSNKGNT